MKLTDQINQKQDTLLLLKNCFDYYANMMASDVSNKLAVAKYWLSETAILIHNKSHYDNRNNE